jgi:MoaA/NifB/PqqE/SkfB family radical SAM enzyme
LLEPLRVQILPDLVELHPTNLGEPFAWPWFLRLCQDLEENGVLLDLTTNGTMLTPARAEWIAPVARDVKVSFDGATAATFERFRRGASFGRVCEAVRGLARRLAAVRVRRPVVALQMTPMRDNVGELPELVRLARVLGASKVKAYHLFSFRPETDDQSLMPDLARYEKELRPEALALGEELGVAVELAEPSGGRRSELLPQVCHLPWHETWIDVDGAVLPCHSHGGVVAGHLEDFQAAWMGPLYRGQRRGLASGQPDGACDGCGMNFARASDEAPVPYDVPAFLPGRGEAGEVRWSGRMKQFDRRAREGISAQGGAWS